jgi:uncharacterized protein YbjT (DUF2867 family)
MIVVTTPTGSIGSQLVNLLLGANETVRVVARDPGKLAPEVRDRAQVVQGSSDDEGVLERALAGAESLFHVVPPFSRAPNVTEYYLQFTRPACTAMKRNRVSRVVTVSGAGRRVGANAGGVTSSFAKDEAFESEGFHVRALWCPGFMENMLRSVESIRTAGAFTGPSRPDVKAPFVATRDIAASAARLLRDRSWTGPGGLAVLGPEDLSLNDVAAITGQVLGRPIRYQQIPADAYKAQLLKRGASEDFAQGLVDMYDAKDRGLDSSEPRTPETSTPTTYRQWCTEVLKPAFAG